jgi:hypothetical protein
MCVLCMYVCMCVCMCVYVCVVLDVTYHHDEPGGVAGIELPHIHGGEIVSLTENHIDKSSTASAAWGTPNGPHYHISVSVLVHVP